MVGLSNHIVILMRTSKVTIITTLVALCVGTNYALVGVPNVKVMDLIVFIGGFCFGPIVGALIGIITWAVYGGINPYGFALQVWLATMFSQSIYGLVGGVLGKNFASTSFDGQRLELSIFFGIIGFVLTLIYDLTTTVVYALTFGVPIIVTIVLGMPFTVFHESSNAIIFGISSVLVITRMEKLLGSERFGVSKK